MLTRNKENKTIIQHQVQRGATHENILDPFSIMHWAKPT
jgi:hypothetical protein